MIKTGFSGVTAVVTSSIDELGVSGRLLGELRLPVDDQQHSKKFRVQP